MHHDVEIGISDGVRSLPWGTKWRMGSPSPAQICLQIWAGFANLPIKWRIYIGDPLNL